MHEYAIAYDEGKVIGVLLADRLRQEATPRRRLMLEPQQPLMPQRHPLSRPDRPHRRRRPAASGRTRKIRTTNLD